MVELASVRFLCATNQPCLQIRNRSSRTKGSGLRPPLGRETPALLYAHASCRARRALLCGAQALLQSRHFLVQLIWKAPAKLSEVLLD
jgi:hypothetical protein